MFTKLKERLAQEASKFPGAQQALTPGRGADQNIRPDAVPGLSSESQSEDLIALNDSPAVITPQSLTSRPELFSIADEDEYSSDQNSSRTPMLYVDPHFSIAAASSSSSEAATMNSYVSQSETEEPATLNLDDISKEQLLSRIQGLKMKNNKYKSKFREVFNKCKQLQGEKEKIESALLKIQNQSVRRISELQETCALEKNAKAHLESNLRLLIEEKDSRISVLETQITLLKESQVNFDDRKKTQSNEVSDDDELPFAREGFQEVCENSFMQKPPPIQTHPDPSSTTATPSSSETSHPESSPFLLNSHALQNETEELSVLNCDMSKEQLFSKIRELTIEKNNYKKFYETYSTKQQPDSHFTVETSSCSEVSSDYLGPISSIPNSHSLQNETGELSVLNLDKMSKEQLFTKIRELTAENDKYKKNYEQNVSLGVAEMKQNMHKEMELKESQIKKLQEENKALTLEVQNDKKLTETLRKQHDLQLQEMRERCDMLVQNAEEDKQAHKSVLQEKGNAIILLQQSHEKKIASIEDDHQMTIKVLEQNYEKQMQSYENMIKVIEDDYETKIQAAKEDHVNSQKLQKKLEDLTEKYANVVREKGILEKQFETEKNECVMDLQKRLQEVTKLCEELQEDKSNNVQILENHIAEINQCHKKICELENEKVNSQELQKELKNLTEKYSDVVREKGILEKQFETEKKEYVMDLQKQLQEVSKLCEELQEDKSNNAQILENHIAEINLCHEKICKLENEKQAMANSQELQTKLEDLTEKYDDVVREKSILEKQFETEKNECVMDLQKHLQEVSKLCEELQEDKSNNAQTLENHIAEINRCHEKISELENENQTKVNSLQQAMNNLNTEYSNAVKEKQALTMEFELKKIELLTENEKYMKEVCRLRENIEEFKLNSTQLSESHITEINNLRKKICELEDQKQELVNNFQNQIQIFTNDMWELQETLKITMQKNRELKDDYDHLRETLSDINPRIQQIQQQDDKMQALFAEKENSFTEELNSIVARNKALDEKLALLDASNAAKNDELKTLKEQQVDNISKIENKTIIITEAYESEISKLNKRIEELQSKNEKLEKATTDLPGFMEIEKSSDDELLDQEMILNLTEGSDSVNVPVIKKVQQLKPRQLDKMKVKNLYMMKLLEYSGICDKNDLNEIMKVPLESENFEEFLKNFCINKMNLLQADVKSCQSFEFPAQRLDDDRTNQNVTSSLNDHPTSSKHEVQTTVVNDITENLPAMTLRDEDQQNEVLKSIHEYYEKIVQEKVSNIKMLEAQISQLNRKFLSSPCENLNISPETSDWDDTWVVPDEDCEPSLLVSSKNEECQNHVREIESMKTEIDSYKSELNELRLLLRLSPPQLSDSIESNLPEPTELEYLKNIMYQFMLGKEPAVLAKVIAAVLKFDESQTKAVLDKTNC